ncbi:hypothetical protein AT746_03395 [Lacimicrobium alkaliphilum]|uniref:N-acetyltransferase domain-containing protein n=1 Tax=Lacimicrobium alkaliphilum TaxID=1526571 RepID=A0A0U2QR42_9ALTE|nr:hypothetical protein AT746_03395 [Lacimicrobium alkaliphilum]
MHISFEVPTVESYRLILRALKEEDLNALMDLWGDEETTRFIGGIQTRASAWQLLAGLTGHWLWRGYGLWGIIDKNSKKTIGWTGIWNPEGWPEKELIWSINKAFWGKGLATEAALAARNYAKQKMGISQPISVIAPTNYSSIAVAKKLGAKYERNWELRGNVVEIWRHPT